MFNLFKKQCDHVWGDIKDGYQYCTKCNLAIPVDPPKCNHTYKMINALERVDYGVSKAHCYQLQCTKCGNLKHEILSINSMR